MSRRRRRPVVRRMSVSEDVAREIEAHLRLRTEELVAEGVSRESVQELFT